MQFYLKLFETKCTPFLLHALFIRNQAPCDFVRWFPSIALYDFGMQFILGVLVNWFPILQ